MASEVLQKVKSAEKTAGENIVQAEEAAARILKDCRVVSAEKVKEIEGDSASHSEVILYEAQKKADEYTKTALEEHEIQCSKLKETAMGKKPIAVEACIKWLFS